MDPRISDTGIWTLELSREVRRYSKNLSILLTEFIDKSQPVYDLGCAFGEYLYDLSNVGYRCFGFEGTPGMPTESAFSNIITQDLTTRVSDNYTKGTVLSFEVAEHIPEGGLPMFLNNIDTLCSQVLILSWAIRGQVGTGHVSCRDSDEVIEIFNELGFKHIPEKSIQLREAGGIDLHYFNNTLYFFKRA